MQFSKSWTLIILSAGSALAGCGPVNTVVWVDIDRAAKAQEVAVAGAALPSTKSIAVPSSVYGVPAIAPSSRGRSIAAQKRRDALDLMRRQLDETFVSLLHAYRRELLGKAAVTEAALKALLQERSRNLADSVLGEVTQAVGEGAGSRAYIITRLALLAGWPDRGGTAFVPIARTSKVEAEWKQEADDLRQKLLTSDAALENRIAAILVKQRDLASSEAAIVGQRIKDTYAKAEEDALQKAVQRVRATGRLDPPQLLARSRAALPGQPSKAIGVPAVVTRMPSQLGIGSAPLSRKAIISQLNIWLRNRGYKLAPGPEGVPDKTGEFIAWSKP